MKQLVFVVDSADAGKTVKRLVHERAGLSNSRSHGLVLGGLVLRNGVAVARPDVRVAEGDRIALRYDPAAAYRAPRRLPKTEGFRIVYEETGFLVADKSAGVLTVPASVRRGDSLVERLEEEFLRRGHRERQILAVHRIDRFTSGLVVVAPPGPAFHSLRAQFSARRAERLYLAVALGRVEPDSGELLHRLTENRKSLKVRTAEPNEAGRWSASTYRVLERFPHASLLEVRLVTGRRNQIRVQLAADGHPLVGDVAYGNRSSLIGRTALHARRLRFNHPATGKPAVFEAEPPTDFRRLLSALRRGERP